MDVVVRQANQVSWADLELVVGKARCHGGLCFCQRFKQADGWSEAGDGERAHRLREQTDCGHPESDTTTGLVGYVDGEPAGWCAVEPRTTVPFIPRARTVLTKRGESADDATVRVISCFVTRTEFRHLGVMRALTAAAAAFARERGARAVEGYPMITEPGQEITWGELHVGSRDAFAAAGFREVAQPTKRRVVMRLDF